MTVYIVNVIQTSPYSEFTHSVHSNMESAELAKEEVSFGLPPDIRELTVVEIESYEVEDWTNYDYE